MVAALIISPLIYYGCDTYRIYDKRNDDKIKQYNENKTPYNESTDYRSHKMFSM